MIENFKYTDKEYDELVKSIVILVDTREKENRHITDFFTKKKIPYKVKSLKWGDYSFYIPKNEALSIPRDLYFDKKLSIERKASLEELSNNLSHERDRFEKEMSTYTGRMILLIENSCYSDILAGNYDTQYNKKSFWATIHSFWFKYNLPFVFMERTGDSGVFIMGTFQYYLRNYLR